MRISSVVFPLIRDRLPSRGREGSTARAPASSERTAQAPPPACPQTVDMLLVLAAEEERERRRKLAETADKGLVALEALHEELLTGTPSPELLQDIVSWADGLPPSQEPILADLMAAIELRARVELAKLDRDRA